LLAVAARAQDLQTGNTLVDGVQYHAADFNNMVNSGTILPTFLSGKGAGTPVSTDLCLFYQGGSSSLKQTTLSSLFSQGLSFNTQTALTVLAGPGISGASAAAPTFRAVSPHDTAGGTNSVVSTTINGSLSRTFYRVLTANTTFTLASLIDGEAVTVAVRQAGSGGPYTTTFTGVFWENSTAPVQTTGASKVDLYTFIQIGGNVYGTFSPNH